MKIEGREELLALFAAQGEQRWRLAATGSRERIGKLKGLRSAIIAGQDELCEAIWQDFRKPRAESWISEIFPTIEELDHTMGRLHSWMRDERVGGALVLPLARSFLRREPKGRVLIMAPWNYPFQLLMTPLLSALAAGNAIIAKPSNKTPATSAHIARLVEGLFPREEVAILEGPGSSLGELLLELPFDHVFFTGSPGVGARVGAAAARIHASLTLELGGKSPAVLLPSGNIADAARKIIWAKCLNAGQTCVAPDYLFCPRDSVADFVYAAKRAIEAEYGVDEAERRSTPDLARIIDGAACQRLGGLVDEALAKGARLELGGVFDIEERYASPTLLTGVRGDMAIMGEEIFGPILPILAYDAIEEVIEFIQRRPKPLALYLFGRDRPGIGEFLERTSSGSVCINDLMLQIENPRLPFGGVGMSGTGSYHGHFGFRTFSHERGILKQGPLSLVAGLYPPYGRGMPGRMRALLELVRGSSAPRRARGDIGGRPPAGHPPTARLRRPATR